MKRTILVTLFSLSLFQMGCSSLKCGCGGEDTVKKDAASTEEHKGCGCEGCKHAAGESCSMKK